MGQGKARTFKHVECRGSWRGTGIVHTPYDKEQAEENRKLYPHLFEDER